MALTLIMPDYFFLPIRRREKELISDGNELIEVRVTFIFTFVYSQTICIINTKVLIFKDLRKHII